MPCKRLYVVRILIRDLCASIRSIYDLPQSHKRIAEEAETTLHIERNGCILHVQTYKNPRKHNAMMGSTMCTFDALMEHTQPLLATEDNYKNECSEFSANSRNLEL
ncbi:hypothetical protein DL89DRAFT_270736 [Linderina pennispora]|uniref:Uncharacterized protein n=1 Tax=Linderina pennispora TaxID=61395 RepID=A0A1Y1VWU8_9FUNG|nr:uncharacterized protein DL89DRAFT_270736 [Linderina pennispora]ORX65683.1 hypothetical protein DL89DRAFT_270736 [Linderina pennispora]